MTFADKVKHVRATLLLSQEQLAEKLGFRMLRFRDGKPRL